MTEDDEEFLLGMLYEARKGWFTSSNVGWWNMVHKRMLLHNRVSKLKPGKNWPRTYVWSIIAIIDNAKPKKAHEDHGAILDWKHMLVFRKRWKRITPHHGYLFWERMR